MSIDFVTMALDKLHFQEWGCMKENQWPVVSLFSTYPVYICSQFIVATFPSKHTEIEETGVW